MIRLPTAIVRSATSGRVRPASVAFLWFGLPALAAAAVIAYIVLAVAWHVYPPAVPVAGVSMRPAYEPGDLVLVKGADVRELRRGDVIAFHPPERAQEQYGLPSTFVHRVAKIESRPDGPLIFTKGDANPGVDVFTLRESAVVGRATTRIPYAGYPILFFRSRQGFIFAGAAVALFLLYVLLGYLDRRQEDAELQAETMAQFLEEARRLNESAVTALTGARAPPAAAEAPTQAIPPERRALHLAEYQLAPAYREEALAADHGIDFDALEAEIHQAVRSNRDVRETMQELVGAVGEYGEHLRSHTEVIRNLAASTAELQAAAFEIRQVLGSLAQVLAAMGEQQRRAGEP